MQTETLDLLIVGAGPSGLLASTIASSIGLKHRVVERRSGLHVHPSAHVVKTHSMEVYRRVALADKIMAAATPERFQRYVTWCESVAGLVYARLDLAGRKGNVPRFSSVSPMWPQNIPQNILEPILHERARALAEDEDIVGFDTELVGHRQDGTGVTATIRTGPETRDVRCRYLIGADGAGSRTRRGTGIEMDGPAVVANFIAINITSDVREFLERDPGVLFFVRAPGLDGTFIMHQPVGSQVFMMRFDPEITPFETYDHGVCREIVRRAFGCDHDFEITGIGQWAMSAQVASSYRDGRVFVVGDAAHRFPPTGGLGLNTGVEDVENLVWKIGAVVRGQADDALLDTYEQECRPIALRNTAQSVENNQRMNEISVALGADGAQADFAAALAAMRDGKAGDRLARLQRVIDDQMKHFAHLELEMAASYRAGAFLPVAHGVARPVPSVEGFQPGFAPGSNMPHLWTSPGVSTIDRLRFDRFILFAPHASAAEWDAAVKSLPITLPPVEVVILDGDAASDGVTAADFWAGEPTGILVRPDGRIAWMEPAGVRDRLVALASAMVSILCPSELPASSRAGGQRDAHGDLEGAAAC